MCHRQSNQAQAQLKETMQSCTPRMPTLWTVPDAMWRRIQAILPQEKPPRTPGRPVVPFRRVFNGILFVLRTGCHWKRVPDQFGSGSTVHRRFQQWIQAGLIERIVTAMLSWYDQVCGVDWTWQAIDTKLVAAPLGGQHTGPNPCDRGKSGSKRHLLVDGRGVPLAIHLTAAHRHDQMGLIPLLTKGWLFPRPLPEPAAPQHACLDKGYDAEHVDQLLARLQYISHIRRIGQEDKPGIGEPVYPARRWKVERSISWLNNMRKLRERWEKKASNYSGLWMLAITLIIYRNIVLG